MFIFVPITQRRDNKECEIAVAIKPEYIAHIEPLTDKRCRVSVLGHPQLLQVCLSMDELLKRIPG